MNDVVMGMVYCGCLNMLVNVFGKKFGEFFDEFVGKYVDDNCMGDVKYY